MGPPAKEGTMTKWTEIEPGISISEDGKRVLVDDCDCQEAGCPGRADMDHVTRTVRAAGYSLAALQYWDAVSDGQPHSQAISYER